MNTGTVDSYLQDGCGRCDRYRTPACKVHRWTDILAPLRELLLESGLTEQLKWGAPCYTLDGKNVAMLSALKDCCVLSFFKGAALADQDGVLERPGPNSRFARVLKLRSVDDAAARREQVVRLVQQAIEVERSGTKLTPSDGPLALPIELEQRLAADPELERAFASLTPGRQRSHAIYVSGAKRSETRERRAERCVAKIVAGKGFNER